MAQPKAAKPSLSPKLGEQHTKHYTHQQPKTNPGARHTPYPHLTSKSCWRRPARKVTTLWDCCLSAEGQANKAYNLVRGTMPHFWAFPPKMLARAVLNLAVRARGPTLVLNHRSVTCRGHICSGQHGKLMPSFFRKIPDRFGTVLRVAFLTSIPSAGGTMGIPHLTPPRFAQGAQEHSQRTLRTTLQGPSRRGADPSRQLLKAKVSHEVAQPARRQTLSPAPERPPTRPTPEGGKHLNPRRKTQVRAMPRQDLKQREACLRATPKPST